MRARRWSGAANEAGRESREPGRERGEGAHETYENRGVVLCLLGRRGRNPNCNSMFLKKKKTFFLSN